MIKPGIKDIRYSYYKWNEQKQNYEDQGNVFRMFSEQKIYNKEKSILQKIIDK